MAVDPRVSAGRFHFVVQVLEDAMLNLDLPTAHPADDMVMILSGKFIGQVTPDRL